MPQWSIQGQEHLTSTLERSIRQGQMAHAYLLVGPPNVGKSTLALRMAQAVNCREDNPPCGDCGQCRRIERSVHPDVQVIAPAQDPRTGRTRVEISIDQVRDLEHAASLGPYEGKCLVFIIDGVERLSLEAANALLKTLEEPPLRVLLLLLASQEDDLLPTIRSRCQRLEVRPLPEERMVSVLTEEHGLSEEDARLLAHLSGGRLGYALAAVKDPKVLGERQHALDTLLELVDGGLERRFKQSQEMATQFSRNRVSARETLGMWLGWWRDLMLMKEGTPELVVNVDAREGLEERAPRFSKEQVTGVVRELVATLERLEQNASPRIALDVLMLAIPRLSKGSV